MQQRPPATLACLVALCLAGPLTASSPAAPAAAAAPQADGRAPIDAPDSPAAVLPQDGTDGPRSTDRAKLGLRPGRKVARVGERFALDVYVRGADGIVSVPFTLSYDPDVVAVIAVELAPGWQPGQEATLMYEARDDGDLVVGLSLIGEGSETLQGRRRLVRVRLIALRPGETALEFRRSALIRPGLGRQPAKLRDARITVRR